MKKAIIKPTLAVVAVAASCFGAWKAYGAYGSVDNSLMMENLEALSQGGDNGDNGGSGNAPSGNLVTCLGDNDWGTTGIMIGNFTTNEHIDGETSYENGTEISFDEVAKYTYEKCFAYYPHDGKDTGNNSTFNTKKIRSSKKVCGGEPHIRYSDVIQSLQELWRKLQQGI